MKLILTKGLAKLGDSVLNFVVSAGISISLKKPCGVKVADKIIRKAVAKECIERIVHKSSLKHMKIEDIVEALIAYIWINGWVTIDELIDAAAQGHSVEESTKKVIDKTISIIESKIKY